MSKSSKSKQSKNKKPQQKPQSSTQRTAVRQKTIRKERGTLLTIALVLIALHGIVAGYLFYAQYTQSEYLSRPWVIGLMVVHSLANVVAAVGIWYWKQWGLYVYAASTLLAVVVGLVTVGVWSVFYFLLPLVIVGYIIRYKRNYFS